MREEKTEKDHYYHIYNIGINGGLIFKREDNILYFITLMEKHFAEKINILAYRLLSNHFYFAVQILVNNKYASQTFSNFFNAYAKAFNKQINRTGTLLRDLFIALK